MFLHLRKAYDDMDQGRFLGILEGYGIVPQALLLLRQYWDHLAMVSRASGYYGIPFKGFRGVTQGDPLSPKLFNVVVDTVIRHFMMIVAEKSVGPEVFDRTVQRMASFFYAGDGLLALTQPEWLQWVFDVLMDLFERVGLKTNVQKMIRMEFQPCHIVSRRHLLTVDYWGRPVLLGPSTTARLVPGVCGRLGSRIAGSPLTVPTRYV